MQAQTLALKFLSKVSVPAQTDYVGIYLTNRCFLSCSYCITNHINKYINTKGIKELAPQDWIKGLNRLKLPLGVPLTFQGGDPFLYKGIWELLENVQQKIDILTALPPQATPQKFRSLKTLNWNKRKAPYPTIRVSFHQGQNDYKELIERIKELQEFLSIGLFHIEHPGYPHLTEEIRAYAKSQGIEFRTKIFLGQWQGKLYGRYKYADACDGRVTKKHVQCRNIVLPVSPEGIIYRCHADLYADRKELAIGKLLDSRLNIEHVYRDCSSYGMCSPCDIKVKTNHLQEDGFCSVDILFNNEKT
jgi:sulfatase maturation enzyme AslB (radical SAM superfamily)